jgi:hypothetical protein
MQILTDAERLAIRAVAGGDRSQLDAASRAFDRAVPLHGVASCIVHRASIHGRSPGACP